MNWIQSTEQNVFDLPAARSIPNMHVHSTWCHHAKNDLEDIAKYISDNNLWMALNEHLAPYPEIVDYYAIQASKNESKSPDNKKRRDLVMNHGLFTQDMPAFLEARSALASQGFGYDMFPLGFEADYFPGFESQRSSLKSQIDALFEAHKVPLNHVSASVHYVEGYSLWTVGIKEYLTEHSQQHLVKRYFDIQCEAVETKDFDFICHPGLIHFVLKKSHLKNIMKDHSVHSAYFNGFRSLIDKCAETSTLIEINTSGIDRYANEDWRSEFDSSGLFEVPNPNIPTSMIRYAHEKGVGFVVGSDWHSPELVDGLPKEAHRYFDQVYYNLKRLGINEVYKIVDRKPVAVPLIDLA